MNADASRASRAIAVVLVAVAAAGALAAGLARQGSDEGARCGPGFVARGARCEVPEGAACPPPLIATPGGCDAPDVRVLVPETTIVVGPSDWEAEGRVKPRTVHAGPFRIDAFEVTRGRFGVAGGPGDAARAASGMTLDEAAAFCARRAPGARLPTEDEWIVAAVSGASPAPRYPWGDTGAVCRRAAWGLATGPCARGGAGPDTVGAHPDGDTRLGVHDLAGNVAEWVLGVSGPAGSGAAGSAEEAGAARSARGARAKGGDWSTALAPDLRLWAALETRPDAGRDAGSARDPRVGMRCVYPP